MTPIFSYSKVYQKKDFESEAHAAAIGLKKEIIQKIGETNLIDLNGQKSVEIDVYKLMERFSVDG